MGDGWRGWMLRADAWPIGRLVGCCVLIHGRWVHLWMLRSDTRAMGRMQDVVRYDLNVAQDRDSVTYKLQFIATSSRANLIL